MILCGTSCALAVSDIRTSSALSVLGPPIFALFTLSSSRYLAVSLVNGTLHLLGNCRSIVDRFFGRSPPSLLLSRNDFSTSFAVRIVSFDLSYQTRTRQ